LNENVVNFYDKVHNLITSIALHCNVKRQSIISTAMVYFHKSFLYEQNFQQEIDVYILAGACFFLATKTCECFISSCFLAGKITEIYKKQNIFSLIPNCLDEMLLSKEFEVMSYCNFDFSVSLPYSSLAKLKPYFDNYLKPYSKKLYDICCFYINDSFKLPLLLYYTPENIAIACIWLMSQNLKINLVDTSEGEKWFHFVDKCADFSLVNEIIQSLQIIYTFPQKQGFSNINYAPGKSLICFNSILNSEFDTNSDVCTESIENEMHNIKKLYSPESLLDSESHISTTYS
jgi:hypothetical protein